MEGSIPPMKGFNDTDETKAIRGAQTICKITRQSNVLIAGGGIPLLQRQNASVLIAGSQSA